jgi:3-hydroxy-9,10-secoandrosta-1,3,5(10)-triene-9,17-dione monooxygenase
VDDVSQRKGHQEMTAMTEAAASDAAVLATAAETLRSQASESERRGRLTDASVHALRHAGLFGSGLHRASLTAVLETLTLLGAGDPAAAWVVGTSAVAKQFASLALGDQTVTDLIGSDTLVCGSGHPAGTLSNHEGRARLRGNWPWISGSDVAEVGVFAASSAGSLRDRGLYAAVVPMSAVTIVPDWQVAGMRATGSNTVQVVDAGVEPLITGRVAMKPSFPAFAAVTVAGPVLGAASAACDHGRELLSHDHVGSGGGTEPRVAVDTVRLAVTAAVHRLDDALATARAACRQLDECGPDIEMAATDVLRARLAHACQAALSVFDPLLDAAGASAFRDDNPLQRLWRDASVGARHPLINPVVTDRAYAAQM